MMFVRVDQDQFRPLVLYWMSVAGSRLVLLLEMVGLEFYAILIAFENNLGAATPGFGATHTLSEQFVG
jgi:hypothetical protein